MLIKPCILVITSINQELYTQSLEKYVKQQLFN